MFPIRRWARRAGAQWSLASAAKIARLAIRVDPRLALLGHPQKGQTRIHPDGQTCDLRSTRQAPLRPGAPHPPAYRKHPSFLCKVPVTPALKQNAHRLYFALRAKSHLLHEIHGIAHHGEVHAPRLLHCFIIVRTCEQETGPQHSGWLPIGVGTPAATTLTLDYPCKGKPLAHQSSSDGISCKNLQLKPFLQCL